jgi:hypothetical protein
MTSMKRSREEDDDFILDLDEEQKLDVISKRGRVFNFFQGLFGLGQSSVAPAPVHAPVSEPNESMISIITSHGGINCRNNLSPQEFRIPEGIEVFKITMAVPGVVNYSDSLYIGQCIKLINGYADELMASNIDDVHLELLLEGIRTRIRETFNQFQKNLVDKIRSISKKISSET